MFQNNLHLKKNNINNIYTMEQEIVFDKLEDRFENKYIGTEPMLLIGVIAIIIIYYYLFSSLGNNEDGSASLLKVSFETTLWILFIVMLLLNGLTYIFGIDMIETLKQWLGYYPEPVYDEEGSKVKVMLKEQVFHLPENKYTYDDAKAICKAYDARLATFDEMKEAYNKGADWCTYGWSDDQMALFPTQREKWDRLQRIKGHEQDCGRPGLNGGYINDASMEYGINCYGSKPSISPEEADKMRQKPFYHKNLKELEFDKKVDYWKNKVNEIEMAPFNHNNWSMI